MTISTPEDTFDGEAAEKFLRHIDPAELHTASYEMRKDEVLALVTSDVNKLKPGRAFKYQDWYAEPRNIPSCILSGLSNLHDRQASGIYGLLPKNFYRDAGELEDEVLATDDSWNDWSPMASDGNTAAFLQLISDNKAKPFKSPVMSCAEIISSIG
jgi:oxalate---CoA ligase